MPSDAKGAEITMSGKLWSYGIGTAKLVINDTEWKGDKEFPCASVDITLAINTMPVASVYVSVGKYLDNTGTYENKKCEPQKLLAWIQHKAITETTDRLFMACSIVQNQHTLFSGYIVSGAYLYSTTGTAIMNIVFTCMGPQARLMCRPVSGYIDTAIGSLVSILQGNDRLDPQSAISSGNSLTQTINIMYELQRKCKGLSLAARLALCVGGLLSYNAYDKWKMPENDLPEANEACVNAFSGDVYLKGASAGMSEATDTGFTRNLWEGLAQRVQSSDVFTAILETLTSTDFGLQVVPRPAQSFKMEICPVLAWTKTVVRIPSSYIVQARATHNIMDRLNEPEIIIINGAGQYGLTQDDTASGIRGIYGIYAKDKELCSRLQESLGGVNGIQALLDTTKKYRVRTITAPPWVDITGCANDSEIIAWNKQKNTEKSDVVNPPVQDDYEQLSVGETGQDNTPMTESGDADANAMFLKNVAIHMSRLASAFKLYNQLAELLFMQYFMATDVAVVDITPDAAFTGIYDSESKATISLWDSIGYAVELNMSMPVSGISDDMMVRGCIRSIKYQYNAADKSSCKLTLTLDRVRMSSVDEERNIPMLAEFPIYTYEQPRPVDAFEQTTPPTMLA